MRQIRKILKACIFIVLCLPMVSHSMNLTFRQSPDLEFTSEHIYINQHKIVITYTLTNLSSHPLNETLVFSQPEYLSPQDLNLEFTVDNKNINYKLRQKSISATGFDVTDVISSLGLPADPVLAIQHIDSSNNIQSIRRKLSQFQLLNSEDLPNWITKSYVYWEQRLSGNQSITVKQSFSPEIKQKIMKANHPNLLLTIPTNLANLILKPVVSKHNRFKKVKQEINDALPELLSYCPSNRDYKHIQKHLKNSDILHGSIINYKFMPESYWANSVKNFTIEIDTNNKQYPMLCWNSPVSYNGSKLVFTATDFVPFKDLSILLLRN